MDLAGRLAMATHRNPGHRNPGNPGGNPGETRGQTERFPVLPNLPIRVKSDARQPLLSRTSARPGNWETFRLSPVFRPRFSPVFLSPVFRPHGAEMTGGGAFTGSGTDRKSTRLNSSHRCISYA